MQYAMEGVKAILTIAIIVYIGFYLYGKGWFDEKSSQLVVRLVTRISLPIFMIRGLIHHFTAQSLMAMAKDLLIPMVSISLAMIGGIVLAKLLHIERGKRGLFITNCFIANTVFIGLPVNASLFGNESIPAAMLYYIANTTFFWTVGVHLIVSDIPGQIAPPLFSRDTLKKVMSPPLIAFIVGLLLVMLGITFPPFIDSAMLYVGNLTTPLSLLFVGIELGRVDWKTISLGRDLVGSILGRFILCPLCVLILLPFIPVTSLSAKVFTLQAAMPAMTQMTIITRMYGGNSRFAAMITLITILGGLVTIPFYMTIVNMYC